MNFHDIKPFVRFARFENFCPTCYYQPVQGLDCRLFYVMSGIGVIMINGSKITLSRGDLLIINSAVSYGRLNSSSSVTYLAVNFDFTFAHSDLPMPTVPAHSKKMLNRYLIEHVEFEDFSAFNTYVLLHNAFFSEAPLIRLEYEYRIKKLFYKYYVSAILSEVLLMAARRIHIESTLPKKNHEKLNKIIEYIHAHYNDPLTNERVAQHFGFHPNHLSALIKSYVGLPLHHYLLNIRMEKAMTMLLTTNDSIESIANEVGISNAAYFSRYFKSFSGLSPSEYRQGV